MCNILPTLSADTLSAVGAGVTTDSKRHRGAGVSYIEIERGGHGGDVFSSKIDVGKVAATAESGIKCA